MSVPGRAGLEHALQLGAQMLDAAREGDWKAVAGLRPEYDALLRQGTPANDVERGFLLQVQQQHQQLVELTAQARDSIARQLQQQRKNHRALNAYLLPCDGD